MDEIKLTGALAQLKKLSKKYGEPIKYSTSLDFFPYNEMALRNPVAYLELNSVKYKRVSIDSKGGIKAVDKAGKHHEFASYDAFHLTNGF